MEYGMARKQRSRDGDRVDDTDAIDSVTDACATGRPVARQEGRMRAGWSATDPIGAGLRHMLATVAEEPVPAEFMALLEQLDDRRAAGAKDTGKEYTGETDRPEAE